LRHALCSSDTASSGSLILEAAGLFVAEERVVTN
jgi:hypothetical protein